MRPKKIYITEAAAANLSDDNTLAATTDICHFHFLHNADASAVKGVLEKYGVDAIPYTDISQVWHPNTDIPQDGDADLLYVMRETDYTEENDMTFHSYNESINERVAYPAWNDVKFWAYVADLLPVME